MDEVELVKKVASGQPLSAAERGHVETRVHEATVLQITTEVVAAAKGPARKNGSHKGVNRKQLERDYAVRERQLIIVGKRLRWPPTPIRKIAEEMGISTRTVVTDLQMMREEHAHYFDGSRSFELAAESLQSFDYIAQHAMELAASYTNPTAKSRMMAVATKALACKTTMMLETGAIKSAPKTVKNEHSGPGGLPLPAIGIPTTEPQASARDKARRLREERAAARTPAPNTVPFQQAAV